MQLRRMQYVGLALGWILLLVQLSPVGADEPKQTPKNTIHLQLAKPVKPQRFSRPVKFYIVKVINRSGDPQPTLVYSRKGGVFLDRQPKEILHEALEACLEAGELLAVDEASADYLLTVYLFRFGLASGGGSEFYSNVELNIVVKNPATGESKQVTALGTSIEKGAFRKKNKIKKIQSSLEGSLERVMRNFLRGVKLRDALEELKQAPPEG